MDISLQNQLLLNKNKELNDQIEQKTLSQNSSINKSQKINNRQMQKNKSTSSFNQLLQNAKSSFKRHNTDDNNNNSQYIQHTEAYILEKTIKRSKKEQLLFPFIREWPCKLKELNSSELLKTVLSGLIMSMLIIPQTMAYTIMIGVPPQYGVYTAGIGAVIYSILGTSMHASVGPCTTTFLMIAKAVENSLHHNYTIDEKVTALQEISAMIGVFLLIMGFLNLGFIENAYSVPAFQGYFKAASFIIMVEQLAKVLAIKLEGENIFTKTYYLMSKLGETDLYSACLGFSVVLVLIGAKLIQRCLSKPNLVLQLMPLIMTVVATLVVYLLGLTDKFQRASDFPEGLPSPSIPFSDMEVTLRLIPEAIKITLVCFSEALMISKGIGQKENYRVATSHELYALGLANLIAPFFTGLTTFVSIVRTPLNVQLGCRSQLGGLLTGLTIILIVATLTPIIKLVPIPLISAIVAFSAFFNVADFSQITLCYKYHRKDFVMFLVTFLLSLLLPLADALLLSAVISLLWILKRSSKPTWFLKQFDIDQNNQQEIENQFSDDNSNNNLVVYEQDNEYIESHLEQQNQKNYSSVLQGVPQEFIDQLGSVTSMESLEQPQESNGLTIRDLCFCHDMRCQKSFHILVIKLQGHLSYVNCKQLQEQAEYMSNVIKAKDNPVNKQKSMDSSYGLQVKALIYNCQNLSSVDYTALQAFNRLQQMIQSRNMICKFSDMRHDIANLFINSKVISAKEAEDALKSTLFNIYISFKEITQSQLQQIPIHISTSKQT